MADAAPPSPSRGFNLAKPGVKEYLIIGGLALIVGYWYFHRKAKAGAQSSAPAAAGTSGTNAAGPQTVVLQGTGMGGSAFRNWLNGQQSSPNPVPVPAQPANTPAPSPGSNLTGLTGGSTTSALSYLQQNGITLNTVQNSQGQNLSPQQYANTTITGVRYYPTGQAGDHFANSATLIVQ